MLDGLGREINYLRISITDRCNLRCRYCMPEKGVTLKRHDEILSFEEIELLVSVAAEVGIRKVRLTGGEPLIRREVVELVRRIASHPLIDDLAITTNGILFSPMARELKEAGLNRVNISLDTMQEERYSYITRGGDLGKVLQAVEIALREDMHPVKINMVVIRGFNEDEIPDFCRLAYERPVHVRFIEFMPVGELLFWQKDRIMKCEEIKTMIENQYDLFPAKITRGNGPAKYFGLAGGQGTVGFISPMSNHFCHECNRLRLTADGKLRACLYHGQETNLKEALKKGATREEIREMIVQTILSKPAKHHMEKDAWGQKDRKMYQIGG